MEKSFLINFFKRKKKHFKFLSAFTAIQIFDSFS